MDRQGDTSVSDTFKQSLILVLLLLGLSQGAQADAVVAPENTEVAAPVQAPVQLGWDRVGDRERNWV